MNKIIRIDFQQKTSETISNFTSLDRLKLALAKLAVQRKVMREELANFQSNIKQLDANMKAVKQGFKDFDSALNNINMKPLRRKTLRLAQITDTWQA
jgi:hypothetical protein